jgi:hypothetical protein
MRKEINKQIQDMLRADIIELSDGRARFCDQMVANATRK